MTAIWPIRTEKPNEKFESTRIAIVFRKNQDALPQTTKMCIRDSAYTVNYDLSPEEAKLYSAVTDYVREEFNRADNLNNEHKTTVGFALTILQRRLASSPEAIYQSLRRRRERLEHRLAEEKLGKRAKEFHDPDFDDLDEDDLSADEQENFEEKVVDHASAHKIQP